MRCMNGEAFIIPSSGSFSRMDALLLLLWLLCAVYRTAMLCAAIRLLWQQPEAEVQP